MSKKKLPNLPSKLLELALHDLVRAEKSKSYVIDMGTWHEPTGNGKCSVCLAGSVMAFSLGVLKYESSDGSDLGDSVNYKVNAIDHFRCGHVEAGIDELGYAQTFGRITVKDREITDYSTDKKLFKKQMRELISDLKIVGL